jgi:hypothetical protein
MSAWRSFKEKESTWEDLPAEFCEVLGPADPPFSLYSELVEVQDMIDAHFSPEMQRTLSVMALAEDLPIARQFEPRHKA